MKKPDSKGHIFYDSIYVKKQFHGDGKQITGCLAEGEGNQK